ncbi:MAG: hypothetical protein IT428_23855 [Planctomycetaceae bacterium]|nr:hypothetical protein [Planctomycetaceae bacterium]
MAKKKSSDSINMAEEIRAVLTENPSFSGREVMEALTAKHPGLKINKASAGVAFSNARKKLGIVKGTTKRRGGARVVRKRVPTSTTGRRPALDIATLQAAVKFVSQIGNAETAIEAVRQVVALQISK